MWGLALVARPLPPSSRAERQVGHPRRQIDADCSLDRQRLQDDAAARTANQDVGTEAGAQGDIAARPHIVAPQGARTDPRIPGEDGPG